MFRPCEARSGCISNLDRYADTDPTNTEHNTTSIVAYRLCQKIKNRSIYYGYHLWPYGTKSICTLVSSSKELPKQTSVAKVRKGQKSHKTEISSQLQNGNL